VRVQTPHTKLLSFDDPSLDHHNGFSATRREVKKTLETTKNE
jgi:hypothetical protein